MSNVIFFLCSRDLSLNFKLLCYLRYTCVRIKTKMLTLLWSSIDFVRVCHVATFMNIINCIIIFGCEIHNILSRNAYLNFVLSKYTKTN